MAEGLQLACPVVRGPAGLEEDRRRRLLREERQEAIAREPPFFIDATGAMRHRDLKHGLCEIDSDGRMLHVDSSLPWPSRGRFTVGTMMPHGRRSPFHRLQPTARITHSFLIRPVEPHRVVHEELPLLLRRARDIAG